MDPSPEQPHTGKHGLWISDSDSPTQLNTAKAGVVGRNPEQSHTTQAWVVDPRP